MEGLQGDSGCCFQCRHPGFPWASQSTPKPRMATISDSLESSDQGIYKHLALSLSKTFLLPRAEVWTLNRERSDLQPATEACRLGR